VSNVSDGGSLGENAEELRERAFHTNRLIEKAPAPFDSWFEVDVALQIASNGYRVVPQYEFADKRIDLVVEGEKSQLAVECDGDFWHGADEYTADMERQRKLELERCGWHFFRIRESRYYADPGKALEHLWTLLDRMGIKSLSAETEPEYEDDENGFDDDYETTVDSQTIQPQEEMVEEAAEESPTKQDKRDKSTDSDLPEDIHQALSVKADVICKAIIQILEQRPKFSSVREKVPTYILKLWNIRSRGKPREQFAKRVDEQIAIMDRKGYIIVYKSKNVRVKLGWVRYPNQ